MPYSGYNFDQTKVQLQLWGSGRWKGKRTHYKMRTGICGIYTGKTLVILFEDEVGPVRKLKLLMYLKIFLKGGE